MRVIAGTARSVPLKTLPSDDIRPTSDRNKETLFNILSPDIGGCVFLDLFSGSGAIGIEALSRGASECDFVENSQKAIAVIEENLKKTRLSDRSRIIRGRIPGILRKLSGKKYDIIFMDPPFRSGSEKDVLLSISENGLLEEDGYIVIESALSDNTDVADGTDFMVSRVKEYKNVKHIFLKREE